VPGHKKKGATVMRRVFVLAAAACGLVLRAPMCVGLGNPEMRTLVTFAGEPSGSTAEVVA
jgi:hypothetical protein